MKQLSRKAWPYQARFNTKRVTYNDDSAAVKLKWLFDYFESETEDDWNSDKWNYTNIGPFMMVYCFTDIKDYEWFVLRWGPGD